MMLALTACAYTHWEKHLLEVDKGAETRSAALKEDGLRVNLVIRPDSTIQRRPTRDHRYFLLTGPYSMYAEVCDGDLRGMLTSIDVREAVLEIRYRETNVQRRMKLSTVPTDWQRFGEARGCFVIGIASTPRLDIDFQRLKEIQFFLQFTGIYPNGERRQYWVQQYVKTTVVHEKHNDFWEMLMGV